MSSKRWGLALAAACAFALGWYELVRDREPPADLGDGESVTLAHRQTRQQLGLMALAPSEHVPLEGRVHDAVKGIADALICAACVACEATSAPSAPCTRSDADGRYAFSDLAVGGYFIAASAAGYTPGSARAGAPVYLDPGGGLSGVDIELTRGGARVRGSVVDATGGPIGHARVRALRLQPPRLSLDLVSDAQGRFELWVQPGFIALSAEAEGYARASQRATAPTEVELRLLPGGSIEGVVIDADSRTPVAAVDVRAAPPDNPQLAMAQGGRSDAAGRFRITGLEPGAYLLSARAERLLGTPAQTIELGVAEQRSGVVIEVSQAAEVAGRVLIAGDARPCQQGLVALGAQSPLEPAPGAEELARLGTTLATLTAAIGPEQVADIQPDGSVHFPAVPPGFYFANVQCVSHLLERGPRLLQVSNQSIMGLEWVVAKGGELSVLVVDERGGPIPEVDVVLEHPSAVSHVVSTYETDALGHCEVDGLSAGSYRIYAGGQSQSASSVEVSAVRKSEVTLRLTGSAMISVELADEHGRPLDGLSVNATTLAGAASEPIADGPRHGALPLGEGRYRIGPLPRGRYAISADDGINPPATPEATPGAIVALDGAGTHTRIVLARGGAISGHVVDAQHVPLADVWVNAKPQLNGGGRAALHTSAFAEARPSRVLTDADGHFTIDGLAPAALFDVRALAPYGSAALQRSVRTGATLIIALPEPASIEGVALDATGAPVAQLMATAVSRDAGSRQTRMFTDPQGRFALSRVAPGAIELTLIASDGRSASSSLELAPGQQLADLRLKLETNDAHAESAAPPDGVVTAP